MRYEQGMRRHIFAALSALAVAACNGTTAPVDENYSSLPADQVAFDVEYVTTEEGIRRANLRADTTLMYDDSALVDLRGVDLDLYDENGVHQATLTSHTGELNRSTNRMVARGEVVLVVLGENGRTIWTEELHYDPAQSRIWSDVHTRSRAADGAEITGDGFTANDDLTNFTVRGMAGSGLRVNF